MNDRRVNDLAERHPEPTEEDRTKINLLYDAYIFRRRKTREIWTSCCRQHAVLEEGHPILEAPHVRGPRTDFGRPRCSCGAWGYPELPKPEPTACPICGRTAKVKELGRSGDRKNLWSFHRAVVLKSRRGVLWALAYDTTKSYEGGEACLTALPKMELVGVYRFDGRRAEYIKRPWGDCAWTGYGRIAQGRLKREWIFPEPFSWCQEYGFGYDLIGPDALKGTPYEYCCLPEYLTRYSMGMKYLALCTVYPRQVEMLMKAGLRGVVQDRLEGKLNAKLLDWDEPNVFRSFGVSKEELQLWLSGGGAPEVLCAYKGFAKNGVPVTLEQTQELYKQFGMVWFERLTVRMKRYGVGYERMTNYLERERKGKGRKRPQATGTAAGWWCDYIDAAAKVGLDLRNPVFLLPKGLERHHDEVTKAAAEIARTQREQERKEKERARRRSLTKKYTFWSDRWLIRPPTGAAEIVAEGEKLKHCVGGYAERHVSGSCTILFLRDRQRPGRPLVTIEMHGESIVQIHGFKDERAPCRANPKRISPRELYREFLDQWLAWLEDGSRRKKNGEPVLPEQTKENGGAA